MIPHTQGMQRLELKHEGQTAFLTYTMESETLSIWHVETPFALRGRGLGGKLVENARALADENGLKLHPVCPFARAHLARNPRASSEKE